MATMTGPSLEYEKAVQAQYLRDAARIAELEAALKAREWQPIETAPKDGTPILGWPVWGGDREVAEIYWQPMRRTPGRWAVSFGPPAPRSPTHWQPLPSPPLS